jgi:predicted AAA+ superfamily ATPase
MKEAHFSFSAETLYKFTRYFKEAFAISMVGFYSPSDAIRNRHYSKVYANDWALASAVCCGESIDSTRLFENMIFIQLLRQGNTLSYFCTAKGHEIDFVARDPDGEIHLYQVCYELCATAREREIRPIVDSFTYLKAASATIVTAYNEEIITVDSVTITVVPAWKWLLNSL